MSNSQQPWLIRYRYDPLDRLTSHTQSDIPERHRFYCKNRLATEIQGAIGHSIVQHGDLLLAQQQRYSDGLNTTLLATDLQRSVLHTVKSDQQPITYSPYGHRPSESRLTSLLGFNGERPDAVTEHYLLGNGYRAFNPVLMRFNSPDSLSPFGKGGLNAYAYCIGDPVNQIDTTGHFAIRAGGRIPLFQRILAAPGRAKRAVSQGIKNISITRLTTRTDKISNLIESAELSNYEKARRAFQATQKQPSSLQVLAKNKIPNKDLEEFKGRFAVPDTEKYPAGLYPPGIKENLVYLDSLEIYDANGVLSGINRPMQNHTKNSIDNYIFKSEEILKLSEKREYLRTEISRLRGNTDRVSFGRR
jgi:RHS repeat-associated protein